MNNLVTSIETTDAAAGDGAADEIHGNGGADVALGGVAADKVFGDGGNDILLGDEGDVVFNLAGPGEDGNPATADRIRTTKFALGSGDQIFGGADNDIALGGTGADLIVGDNSEAGAAPEAGGLLSGVDILIGDQGQILLANNIVGSIETTDVVIGDGAADEIHGNGGADVALGGVAADKIFGDGGKDILLGDEGEVIFNLAGPGGDGIATTVDRIRTTKFASRRGRRNLWRGRQRHRAGRHRSRPDCRRQLGHGRHARGWRLAVRPRHPDRRSGRDLAVQRRRDRRVGLCRHQRDRDQDHRRRGCRRRN